MISKENITDIARKIADCFNPEKIILFGSYAWGKPDRDSDLDLFVIMESTEKTDKARRIPQAGIKRPLCSYGYTRSHV
jgi:uncharacterized protein